jgi:hypothetical protein
MGTILIEVAGYSMSIAILLLGVGGFFLAVNKSHVRTDRETGKLAVAGLCFAFVALLTAAFTRWVAGS